jgi:hypothetical protein
VKTKLLRRIGLICLVLVAGWLFSRFVRTTSPPEYGSEEYRKMFPASADPQRFEKAREAQEKTSKEQQPSPQKEDDATRLSLEACLRAQSAVRAYLKAPSTAKFPGCVFGANEYEIRADAARETFYVLGHVDSQNDFGAMLRSQFVVKMQRANDTWKTISVNIE